MRWSWFGCGVCFLLLGSYMDNVRGPLLPALSQLLNLTYSASGNMLVFGNITACLMTLVLIPATNRWSLRRVSVGALAAASLFCLSTYWVRDVSILYVWGACLGGMVSVLGAISNIFVQHSAPPQFRARAMSGSHAAYGFASFVAPLIAGQVLKQPDHWTALYLGIIPLLLLLGAVSARVAPSASSKVVIKVHQTWRLSGEQWLLVGVLIAYVAGEVLSSIWMTSWFVARGDTLQNGAFYTAMFFILMTGTRVLCSLFMTARWLWPVLWASLMVPTVIFVLGRLWDIPWMIPLMGLLGPFFPLFISYVAMRYPDRDRVILIWMIAAMQGLLAVVNLTVGYVAVQFGLDTAYWLAPAMIGVAMGLLALARREKSKI